MVYVLDLVCNIPGLQERGREREILKLNNWVYCDLLYSYLFQVFKLVFYDKLLKRNLKKNSLGNWKDKLSVNIFCCSSRKTEFNFQHPHRVAHNSLHLCLQEF